MKSSTLSLTDLILFRDLFAADYDLLVIDPEGRVEISSKEISLLKSQSSNPIQEFLHVDLRNGNFSFSLSDVISENTSSFDFINNTDGSIRWFFPTEAKQADFLSLYNSSSLKSKIYTTVTHFVWNIGMGKQLTSGSFIMQQILVDRVKTKYGISEIESYSFFTGTRGATRKLVMKVQSENGINCFIKIPQTTLAEELVQNEYDMVKTLNKFDFTSLSLPRISSRINGHYRLSDVKPAFTIPADKITAIHASAVAELYAISHDRKTISETKAWETIEFNIYTLFQELEFKNNLDQEKIGILVEGLKKLYATVSENESVPVSVSHGDFTPWNMYCDEQRLYVYDWEMAKNGIPMLFDLFHFSYQSVILLQKKSYKEVHQSIQQWLQQPLVLHLIQKYRIHVPTHHALYLLFNVSFYLRQYLNEKEPLMQSEWMMDAWKLAIDDCLNAVKLNQK